MAEPRTLLADYPWFLEIAPRWRDNDVFGHVNNAVYYEYVDTAVIRWIEAETAVNLATSPMIAFTVESGCKYYSPLAFPDPVVVGLRIGKIGNSSVRYEVGLFRGSADRPAAEAFFVHVYVNSATRRPVELPEEFRAVLSRFRGG